MPMYPEEFITPMRKELTNIGFVELKSAADVDQSIKNSTGTVLVVVNSMCGCAAGKARPGIALSLQNEAKPDKLTTVFAGQDPEPTAQARSYFTNMPPSSPSVALIKDGQLVYMLHRKQIEILPPQGIAAELVAAYNQFCK